MTVGRRPYAWLGAWESCLPGRGGARFAVTVLCTFTLISGMVLGLAPTAALADESAASGGTVRVRSVDNAETVAESVSGDDVAAVAARAMPQFELDTASAPAPSMGESIVAFALQFVGYPYVWAGNTPAGFDCSGFTQYVILNTVGIDIGHGLTGQPGAGAWVDAGALLPGDIIFFQNTYQPGLSHVGIYIGDGLFVHAENEGTGVVISGVWSDYYGSRYWGAVRVA